MQIGGVVNVQLDADVAARFLHNLLRWVDGNRLNLACGPAREPAINRNGFHFLPKLAVHAYEMRVMVAEIGLFEVFQPVEMDGFFGGFIEGNVNPAVNAVNREVLNIVGYFTMSILVSC